MVIIIGLVIVFGSIISGYMMEHGLLMNLYQPAELVIIGGAGLGSLIVMSPTRVIKAIIHRMIQSLKGSPYSRKTYEELMMALYELFLLGRRSGMIPLEAHLSDPKGSSIFSKYPTFINNRHAVQFLCSALRPIVDGRIRADQLKMLLDSELESLEEEHGQPINVVSKVSDAMPGFGIVAAVLGIVLTMGSIGGPVEEIGPKVGAALVGTFLGILIAYGCLAPLAMNMEFNAQDEMSYLKCMSTAVIAFANGMAPIMAIEVARRGLNSELRPTGDELEAKLKPLNAQVKG